MRNPLLSLLILILLSAQGSSQDKYGFFGFHRGMTQDEIIALVGKDMVSLIKGEILVLQSAPRPHPDFEEGFTLTISPDKGLLQIIAFSKAIRADRVEDKFYEKVGGLETTYDKPTMVDIPLKKELMLYATWKAPTPDLERMLLSAVPVSDSRSFLGVYKLVLYYEFVGFTEYYEGRRVEEKK